MRLIAALHEWLDREGDRLVLWLPVFMGAGVLTYYTLAFEPALWIGAAVAVPAIAAATWLPSARFLLAPVAAAALGFASAQLATARAPPIETALPPKATLVTGTIAAVEALPEGRRITINPAFLDGSPLRRSARMRRW